MSKPNLADTLTKAGGGTRRAAQPQTEAPAKAAPKGRAGTKTVTGHFPPSVHQQIKLIAVEQGRQMQDVLAEAYNDLFAKYGKPEVAPAFPSK